MKRYVAKILLWIGSIYLVTVIVAIIISKATVLFKDGIGKLWEFNGPFSLWNFIGIAVAIAPGLLLLWLAEHAEKKLVANKRPFEK